MNLDLCLLQRERASVVCGALARRFGPTRRGHCGCDNAMKGGGASNRGKMYTAVCCLVGEGWS